MKRRAVTVPVPSIPVSVSFIGLIFCLAVIANDIPHWLHSIISCVIWAPSLWNVYGGVRRIGYNNEPITLAVGPKPLEAAPEPEKREPSAFPPQENQCFVCGNYDQHRQEVFGDASHATCREWLGDWKVPRWIIGYEERAPSVSYRTSSGHRAQVQRPGYWPVNIADLSGLRTRQQVIDYCHEKLAHDLDRGLFAEMELHDGQTIRFNIPVPEKPVPEPVPGEPNAPIDPEVAKAFYNNLGLSFADFLRTY